MYSYSDFKFTKTDLTEVFEIPMSEDYRVLLCGKEIPVYSCRISAYPLNTWWPGHQRPVNQTEKVSYINLVSDEEIELTVQPLSKKEYSRIMIKPYSKGVKFTKDGENITFKLSENGAYVLELDDYHGLLYIFNNKPVPCEDKEKITYYFGPGVHFTGRIELKSDQSIYVDKDALVYGCVYAKNAENISICGNGVFDDSWEERYNQHCYTPYTNGNVKFYDCRNIKMQGVGYTNSALWCINLFHCFDAELDGINIFGQWRYNTDGIDMMNSQRIVIKNSFVHSFDDTVVVKGIDRYSFDNCQDILTENCVLWCDWGKTCEIGLETASPEYKNIIFRNCDVLRGGNTVCDIQNGDWAYVHDIVFEDIRIEMEGFYTPPQYQENQSMVYDKKDETEIPYVLNVQNRRFREAYKFLVDEVEEPNKGTKKYAGVSDVIAKDITVYADGDVMSKYGNDCIMIKIDNIIPGTEFSSIKAENIILNSKKLSGEDMKITLKGVEKDVLEIK